MKSVFVGVSCGITFSIDSFDLDHKLFLN